MKNPGIMKSPNIKKAAAKIVLQQPELFAKTDISS
jgi:hypothetical protein